MALWSPLVTPGPSQVPTSRRGQSSGEAGQEAEAQERLRPSLTGYPKNPHETHRATLQIASDCPGVFSPSRYQLIVG